MLLNKVPVGGLTIYYYYYYYSALKKTLNVTLRRVRLTTVAVEKQHVITYSVCVFVVLGIQHALPMSRIIFSFVDCPALTVFLNIS
jgi:hypothetical protein